MSNKLLYKGEFYSQLSLSSMPECDVSPRQFARNIAKGLSVEQSMLKVPKKYISKINSKKAKNMDKRKNNGRKEGSKNNQKKDIIKSELPKISKEEAQRIMEAPVNPDYCRYHRYKVFS